MFARYRRTKRAAFIILFSCALALPLSTATERWLAFPLQRLLSFVLSGSSHNHHLDEKGIPKIFYLRDREVHGNPVYVCMYAYGYYQLWKKVDAYDYFLAEYPFYPPEGVTTEQYRTYFFNCADWLVRNLRIRKTGDREFAVWEYDFPWTVYRLRPPWVSGMAQGCGIEVLVKAYQESGRKEYLDAAKAAMEAFFVTVRDGGVTRMDTADNWWYEEYASPSAPQSRVLNGMEHALIGLHAYWQEAGDPRAAQLFDNGMRSLRAALGEFDAGRWTYYDRFKQVANLKYHNINVALTAKLAQMTGDPSLANAAEKWRAYRSSFFVRYFVWQKPRPFYAALFAANILLAVVPSVLCVAIGGAVGSRWMKRRRAFHRGRAEREALADGTPHYAKTKSDWRPPGANNTLSANS